MKCCKKKKKTHAEMTRMERIQAKALPAMSYEKAESDFNFFKIPTGEDELHKVCFFWNMDKLVRVDEEIKVKDIKDDTLKLIYEEKTEEAMTKVEKNFIEKKWANDF
jgi:hypothetical protein